MTVARLQAEMSNAEYVRWGVYFARKAQRQELEKAKGAKS
jgi:hypothetical protein